MGSEPQTQPDDCALGFRAFYGRHIGVPARRIYVDETKQQGFVLVAGVVVASDQGDIKRTLRELTKPGQNRIHLHAHRLNARHDLLLPSAHLHASP